MGIKVGVNGVVKDVSAGKVGVSGVVREVSEGWCGVGGVAKRFLGAVPVGTVTKLTNLANDILHVSGGTQTGTNTYTVSVGDKIDLTTNEWMVIWTGTGIDPASALVTSGGGVFTITITGLNPTISGYVPEG